MTNDNGMESLLFGRNAEAGLVAAEWIEGDGGDSMELFLRGDGDDVACRREPFRPFLWLEDRSLLDGSGVPVEFRDLDGDAPLRILAEFPGWAAMRKALDHLRKKAGPPSDVDAPYLLLNDPIQQFLLATGRTFFKGMTFDGLRRFAFDIETRTAPGFEFSNPQREEDRVLAIAMADSTGWVKVLSGAKTGEKDLLLEFVETVRERDPDTIEGHNVFGFDLPYLQERAKRHRVKLAIGRDGSAPKTRPGRFQAGERTLNYTRFDVYGRTVLDTYFLVQLYDISHRSLPGFGLKESARHFGLAAKDRVYLEGAEIASTFEKDPERVLAYAEDDVRETLALGGLLSPVYFAQAQLVPFSYQNVMVRGNATKIDSLMLREYTRQGASVPKPDAARPFEGGYTDIFFTGVARNVHHCDVRSLYPSIMLKDRLGPSSDRLGAFLRLLEYLRTFRLAAKARMKKAKDEPSRRYEDALQSTFKILINSFYGYLGFAMARFNDFDAAEKVTATGRTILRGMIDWLETHGAKPIEIDTDGIYYIPPEFKSAAAREKFEKDFGDSLPEGIDVEFDGEYESMFSYKMKNYALLDRDGEITVKGAALKSRGLEPFQREFLREWLELKLTGRDAEAPALVQRYRKAIENREWPIQMLAKTERLQEAPAAYQAKVKGASRSRNAALELALKSGRPYGAGDTISYYVTGTKKSVSVHEAARRVVEWDPDNRDENVVYYLAKLDELVKKFVEGLASSDDARQGTLF